jgi:hypothetical protein
MKFAIVVEASEGVADKTQLIHILSNKLSDYFLDKDYGNDVREIFIKIISVAPEFEWFSTIRKPKYTSYRKYINRDGIEIIEDKSFSFDLKLDFEDFKNQSDDENRKMLASEIIKSLSNLDSLPKKVKDFDKERFKEDMKSFFDEQKLLVKNDETLSFI